MRSIFFVDKRLFVFSKHVSHEKEKDFFTSFALVHFEPNEYSLKADGDNITISANIAKTVRNLVTEKTEKKAVSFNFIHQSVKNHIVSKEEIMTSAHLKAVYAKYGTLASKIASIDMEGYAITVPHFAPHPYLLQTGKELGYGSNRDFQERGVIEYFKSHTA
jgi:hypothetical protein